jgi:hypothetical protein
MRNDRAGSALRDRSMSASYSRKPANLGNHRLMPGK